MKLDSLLKRANELLEYGQRVLGSTRQSSYDSSKYVDSGLFAGFRAAALSFFKSTFGELHPYYKDFDGQVKYADPYCTDRGIGILNAAKDEIQGGWLISVKGLVSAEIFSDFFDMASYLLSEDYKDPAAVMIGSILEEHLRQLCTKNGITTEVTKDGRPVPKKADALNSELASNTIYSKLDQKNVTSWLDLRNKAAHGRYSEYTKEQVNLMSQAVIEFMTRVSL
ncbi:MAG: hypothetical protein ABSA44_12700 [Bacteroidota bacterium]|jgi:hypothetical protein